ncbi:hypothetical protein ACIPJS_33830 [Streptomyces sp. NPDC086783]|uniref:hypothetical protein n=1 Tax=Streptomyces sp. NPDC086783 TaxID=3365758 RepID=UPI00382C082F
MAAVVDSSRLSGDGQTALEQPIHATSAIAKRPDTWTFSMAVVMAIASVVLMLSSAMLVLG